MSAFEFLFVGVTFILALAFTRYAEGMYHAARSAEPYWVHIVLMVFGLIHASSWMWSFRNDLHIQVLPYSRFVISLLGSLAHAMMAYALAGPEPSKVQDARKHFESVRRPFYSLLLIPLLGGIAFALFYPDQSGRTNLPVELTPYTIGLILALIGRHFGNERAQGIVSTLLLATVVAGSATLFMTGLA